MIGKADIIRLFREVESFLPDGARYTIFVIGGSAACLLDSKEFSRDIDILSSIPHELEVAIEKAKLKTGLSIEIGFTSPSRKAPLFRAGM